MIGMVIVVFALLRISTLKESYADTRLTLDKKGELTVEVKGDVPPDQAQAIAAAQEAVLRHNEQQAQHRNALVAFCIVALSLLLVLFVTYVLAQGKPFGLKVKASATGTEFDFRRTSSAREGTGGGPTNATARPRRTTPTEVGILLLAIGVPVLLYVISGFTIREAHASVAARTATGAAAGLWIVAGTVLLIYHSMQPRIDRFFANRRAARAKPEASRGSDINQHASSPAAPLRDRTREQQTKPNSTPPDEA